MRIAFLGRSPWIRTVAWTQQPQQWLERFHLTTFWTLQPGSCQIIWSAMAPSQYAFYVNWRGPLKTKHLPKWIMSNYQQKLEEPIIFGSKKTRNASTKVPNHQITSTESKISSSTLRPPITKTRPVSVSVITFRKKTAGSLPFFRVTDTNLWWFATWVFPKIMVPQNGWWK